MIDLLGDIVAWMEGLEPAWLYATIFLISFLENVIPPIPGDMVIVFAGYLVGLGHIAFFPVLVVATIGGTAGFMTLYGIGWSVGAAVFDVDRMRWVPKKAAVRARAWLLKYGYGVVAANRFLSGVRSVISLAVGAARMHPLPTTLWATASAGLWCALILFLGYWVGDQWAVIGEYLRIYGQWVIGLLILAVVLYTVGRFYLAWRADRTRHEARRSSEDPPGAGQRPPQH